MTSVVGARGTYLKTFDEVEAEEATDSQRAQMRAYWAARKRRSRAFRDVERATLGKLADAIIGSRPKEVERKRERSWLAEKRKQYVEANAPIVNGIRVVSSEDAALIGWDRYFTNEPCSAGHVSQRYTKNGACCSCAAAKQAAQDIRDRAATRLRAERAKRFAERDANWKALQNRINLQRRRQRVDRSPSHFTAKDVARIRVQQKNRCGACRDVLAEYHIDHYVPLARGGTNEARNIQLLCPSCNHAKAARDPIEFMQSKFGRLL